MSPRTRLIPSIASANPLCYDRELERLGDYPLVHLDLEDGVFLPNITFGLKTVKAIAAHTNARLDAHLMVMHPMDWLEPLAGCGVAEVCAHIELLDYPLAFLEQARRLGMRAGLALNYKTPAQSLEPFADCIDYAMLMSAEADGGDYSFRPYVVPKLQQARQLLPPQAAVWVDGGVGEAQLPQVAAAGADTVILGRTVWQSPHPRRQLDRLLAGLELAHTDK